MTEKLLEMGETITPEQFEELMGCIDKFHEAVHTSNKVLSEVTNHHDSWIYRIVCVGAAMLIFDFVLVAILMTKGIL